MFRRMLFILVVPAMLLGSILTATAAQAASYHFVGAKTCTQSTSADGTTATVTCSFSVAGLGNTTNATAYIQAPYYCSKESAGKNYTQPGGLAKSPTQTYQVRNGRIDVTNLSLTASCPDQFTPHFSGPVSVYVNNTLVGTIQIT